MDRGIWATWYDLPEGGKEEYLDWLHEKYIPETLSRPGVLWGAHYASVEKSTLPGEKNRLSYTDDPSVPSGDRYILLFGGETAHAFFDPTPAEDKAKLSTEGAGMLGRRIGERSNIFTEEARQEGPEVAKRGPGLTPGPCIQLGSFNSQVENEDELGAWYARWRLPCMGRLPGCIGVRNLASSSGWAKHAVLYEFVSLEARNAHFPFHEDPHPEEAAWTDKVVRKLVHAPGSPNVALRLWPAA